MMFDRQKVLVSGGSQPTPEVQDMASELGKALVASGSWVVVTGGLQQKRQRDPIACDFQVAEAAVEAAETLGLDPRAFVRTLVPERANRRFNYHSFGEVLPVAGSDRRSRRFSMVLDSDAVVALAGSHRGTGEVVDLAWMSRKPVIPLPSTGGAAGERWNRYKEELIKRLALTDREVELLESGGESYAALADLIVRVLRRSLRPTCFVATAFSESEVPSVADVVEDALEELGYRPLRLDRVSFTGNIIDAIWDGIRNAAWVLVDITGNKPNVYYELGISHALTKETTLVVYSESGKLSDTIPFDIGTHRIHPYANEDQLRATILEHVAPARNLGATTVSVTK